VDSVAEKVLPPHHQPDSDGFVMSFPVRITRKFPSNGASRYWQASDRRIIPLTLYRIWYIINITDRRKKGVVMWDIELYVTASGEEVVADFLDGLPRKHHAKAIWEIELLSACGPALQQPYVKHISGELWELRIKFSSEISRIFYFIPTGDKIVLLHGFVKKTQKTPPGEIETATKRMTDYKRRYMR
jgi:phage-related protein